MTPGPSVLNPFERVRRQRAIILRAVRVVFFVLVLTVTLLITVQASTYEPKRIVHWWVPLVVSCGVFAVALTADLLTPNKKISTITGVLVGIMAGLLATLALGFVIDLVVESWVPDVKALDVLKPFISSIKVLIGITLSYLGISTVLQTQDDFRLVIPYVEFAKQLRGPRPMLLDSSALIDGRLADMAATGFMQAPLVIPRFVVGELQTLADSADPLKRAKGRRGLDVVTRLQRSPRLDVSLDESNVPGGAAGKGVDQMLVELARSTSGVIVTTDHALGRVASIHSVPVLNLHDLANAMKSSLVPGESVAVRLIRVGEQQGQGVGYLPDGTMIVAEDGAAAVGQTVMLVVLSSLQTAAGRMIFARLAEGAAAAPEEMGAEAEVVVAMPEEPPAGEPPRPRSPFPPTKPKSLRSGTPRNPRR